MGELRRASPGAALTGPAPGTPGSAALALALAEALRASGDVALLVTDAEDRLIDASSAARTALGLPEELAGLGLDAHVAEEDLRALRAARAQREAGPHLLRPAADLADPDRALLVSALALPGEGATLRVLLGRVAGPEIRREARLVRAARQQIVGQFSGGIAHELNNRLSTVTTFSDLLLADAEPGSQDAEDLAAIKQAGLDAADITRKMDLYAGGHAGTERDVNLAEVVRGLEKLLRRFLAPEVELHIETGEGPPVEGPSLRLEEILVSLVADARDASRAGDGLTVRTGAGRLADGGPAAVLEVAGAGPAMRTTPLERALAAFFRGRGAATAAGLAPSPAQVLVAELGGTLEQLPGENGSVIRRVTLPRAKPVDADVERVDAGPAGGGAGRADAAPAPRSYGVERIVLVEPDTELRAALRRDLQARGIEVSAVGRSEELAEGPAPSVVVADGLEIPGADAELVARLRARWPDVPVVLLRRRASRPEGPVPSRVVEVPKPFDPARVLLAAAEAMAGPVAGAEGGAG